MSRWHLVEMAHALTRHSSALTVASVLPVEDWSEKQDVNDRLTPYNWLFIQHADVQINGEDKELTIPRRCMHCRNAPCSNLCPFGAAFTQDNGIVRTILLMWLLRAGFALGVSPARLKQAYRDHSG